MISVYSLPAAFALLIKLVVLHFSWRAGVRDTKTRLFLAMTLVSLALSVVETAGVNWNLVFLPQEIVKYHSFLGHSYYGLLIPFLALLVMLAVVISEDTRAVFISISIAVYAVILECLLFFTSLLIVEFQPLKYTLTRVPGPLFGLFELLTLICALAVIFFPLQGIRAERSPLVRSQCKLWLATASPVVLIVVVVFALLHFDIRIFNTVATLPLASALLLVAVGYAVHNQRIIELDFYLPWSPTRKRKTLLYSQLGKVAGQRSAEEAIRHLAEVLKCPAVWKSIRKACVAAAGDEGSALGSFPHDKLEQVDRMLVANEGEDLPEVRRAMKTRGVGVIIPFFPLSSNTASWLLLGDGFNRQIYTPLDFTALQRLLDDLAVLLLDELLRVDQQDQVKLHDLQSFQESLQQQFQQLFLLKPGSAGAMPLEEYLWAFEAAIIKRALDDCGGNQARAAELLGLRRNTLHYKLERHGIATPRKKSPPVEGGGETTPGGEVG